MSGTVDRLRTGLQCITHDNMVNGIRRSTGFVKGTLDGHGPQFLCADGLQTTTCFAVASLSSNPFTKRCSSTANNDYIFAHGNAESYERYEHHSLSG